MEKYIILLDKDHLSRCGSDMAERIHYKRNSKIREKANAMLLQSRFGVYAYLLPNYTQKLCELSPLQFSKYIQSKCHLIAQK